MASTGGTLSTTAITTTLPPNSSPTNAQSNATVAATSASSSTSTSTSTAPASSPVGTGSLSNYNILQTIGRGNFGVVFLAELKSDGRKYVVKQIAMDALSKSEREGALQEVKLLSELRHQCIVSYRESFIEGDTLYIVMHYCEGGDLTSLIKKRNGEYFTEEQVLDWFVQLCLALQYCHHRRIIHRDLKSQNVFLTKKHNVRLGDFGIARVLNGTNEMAMTVVGTPYSMSPEVCGSKPYGFASDIWALGCVLYELCVLKHAFDSNNILGLVWKIVMETYPPIPNIYSENLSSLVNSMLDKDPTKRPTIDEILSLDFIRRHLGTLLTQKLSLRKMGKRVGSASADSTRVGTATSRNHDITSREPTIATAMTQTLDKTSPARPTLTIQPSSSNRPATPPTPVALQPTSTLTSSQLYGTGTINTTTPSTPKMINVHAPATPSTQQRLTPRTPTHSSASLPSPLHLSVQAPPSTSTSTSKPTSTSQQTTRRHSAIETTEYARLNAMTNTVSPRDQRDRVLEMKRARKEAEQKQYLAALNEAITTTQMENSRAADRAYHELHPSHQRPGTTANQHRRQGSAGKDRDGSPAQGPLSARNTSPQSNPTASRHPDFRDAFDSSSLDALSPLPSSPLHRHRNTGTIRSSSSSSSQLSAAQQEYIQQQQRAGRAHSADANMSNASNAPTTVVRSNSRGDDRPIRSSGRYDFGNTQVDVQHSLYGKPEDSDYPDDFENFDIATDDEDEQLVNLLHSATIAEKPTYAFRGYMGPGVSPTSAYTTGSPTSATTPRGNLHKSTSNHAINKTSRSPSQPNISLLAQQQSSTSTPPSNNTSLATANTQSIQPSMSHKCEAIKRSALRQLTETEFQEIYQFFKAKQHEESTRGRGLPSPSGSSKVTKAELMNKFGTINSQAVFHIEQLVFLESMLANP